MHFNNHTTVLQGAREENLNEFVNSYDFNSMLQAPNDYLVGGAPLVKCLPKTASVENLIARGAFAQPVSEIIDKGLHIHVPKKFMKMITESIVNINKAGTYKECIKTMQGIKNSLGNDFYGALFISGKTILNPFHPVTAMLMADENIYTELHSKNYRIAVYAYESTTEYDKYHTEFNSESSCIKYIESNIDALIQMSAHQIKTRVKSVGVVTAGRNSESVNLEYKVSKHPEEDPDYELYLSAHQLLTNGIVMPWYGSSLIKMNDSTSGYHISPMRSCNIAGGPTPESSNAVRNWDSVCTGSLLNSTLTGLRTLNHANLLSPFNSSILAPGALVYAQVAVNKSFQIYRSAGFIEGEINECTYFSDK